MAKKTVGYVRLQWTCPNCGAKNPGPNKTCAGCGAPQPENVAFEQAAQEKLVQDQAEIQQAKAGPDIHCAYCGARNPAGTKICSQCGADLTEGKARKAGDVLGAFQDKKAPDVACPSCGTLNPASALKCAKCGAPMGRPVKASPQIAQASRGCSPIVYVIGAVAIGLIALLVFLLTRTNDVVATVTQASWQRSIAVEALVPVTHEGWLSDIPAGADVGTCSQKIHHTQDQPAPGAVEVCGTPYTQDTGSGYGEVVQDCEYQVYADWCAYSAQEWQVVDSLLLTGDTMAPTWPAVQLQPGQREGPREEQFSVTFDADGKTYGYSPSSLGSYQQYQPGSRWILQVNKLGAINDIQPAR